jgi:2'-5' RNA ligase
VTAEEAPARLFVAVWPAPAVVAALSGLRRPEGAGVRWTPPEQWHVTLRFLGRAVISEAAEALAGVHAPACEAVLATAPKRLFRGVLAVSVSGLDDLAAEVMAATGRVGQPAEDRPFRAHITVARWRDGPAPVVRWRLEARWTVDEVTLVRSTLSSAGARYDVVERVTLPS